MVKKRPAAAPACAKEQQGERKEARRTERQGCAGKAQPNLKVAPDDGELRSLAKRFISKLKPSWQGALYDNIKKAGGNIWVASLCSGSELQEPPPTMLSAAILILLDTCLIRAVCVMHVSCVSQCQGLPRVRARRSCIAA